MTKRKVPSKSIRAQAFMESNPEAKAADVARRFGMTTQSIYGLRNKMKKEAAPAQQSASGSAPLPIEMFDFPDQVDETLDARAVDYGKFIEGAEIMQMLKRVVRNALDNRDKTLAHDQAEAMDMIIHKIGRIVNGNPDVVDHWLDIAGYAQLVADRLEGRIR